jgi:hypothetical protein
MSDIGIFIFGDFVFALALTSAMVFLLMPGGLERNLMDPGRKAAPVGGAFETASGTSLTQYGSPSGHAA